MKTSKIFSLTLLILFVQVANSQNNSCWYTLNTITTKWEEPNTSNIYNFDWTKPGNVHRVYLQDGLDNHSLIMELPYFCSNPIGSGNCGNNNTFQYEELNSTGEAQDIYPENGWELVVNSFGTPNSSPGNGDGKKVKNPFFVLYNKYTGVMKVFVAVLGNLTANSAKLEIGLDQLRTRRAVFAHANIIAKTAQPFDYNAAFSTLNEYNVQASELDYSWLVAEIQTTYDPCTCNNPDMPGFIEITPWLISTSTITASIEGQLTQQLMDNNGVQSELGGKTSFNDKAVGAIKAGIKSYSQFSGYKNDVNTLLDNANNNYKNKLINQWFDAYVAENPQYQGVNNLPQKFALWDALHRTDDEFKKSIGIENIDKYQTSTNFTTAKTLLSYLPYVGTAIGVIDFLTSGGKETPAPKPSPPMVFNVSLKLDGQIVTPVKKDVIKFQIPGTSNTQSNLSPFYNNVLGVFNIVKPPAVNASKVIATRSKSYYADIANGSVFTQEFASAKIQNRKFCDTKDAELNGTTLLKQYKLNEHIKYILNPAAQVNVELIDACLVLEYDNSNNLNISNNFFDVNLTQNQSIPYHSSMFNINTPIEQRIEDIEKTGLDLEYISHDSKIIRFRTKYVPLTCLMNQSLLLYNGLPPKVYVKLMVKMKRNDNSNSEMITQIATYDISTSFVTPNIVVPSANISVECDYMFSDINIKSDYEPNILEGTFHDFRIHSGQNLQLPSNLHFPCHPITEDKTYISGLTGLNITGTLFIPDNTIVTANTWLKAKKIIIGNNVTIDDGVELISGSTIDFGIEGIMNPSSILKVEPWGNMETWNCPDIAITSLHATDAEIHADLCNHNTYKASAKLTKIDESTTDEIKNEKTNLLDFIIYPNPAQNNINITVTCNDNERIKLSVVDIAGKELSSNLYVDNILNGSVIKVDLTELSSGIYLCSLISADGVKMTKKFIVVK